MNPPDSPLLPPDDLAAMRREWAELRARLPLCKPQLAQGDRFGAPARQMAMLRDFLERHRAALAAPELTEPDREPQEMACLLQPIVETSEEAQRAEEAYLQRIADLADGCQELVLSCLRKLAWLESMPQEEWDALPPDRRVNLYTLLEALRPSRESMLGTMPIEFRREWERRLGT